MGRVRRGRPGQARAPRSRPRGVGVRAGRVDRVDRADTAARLGRRQRGRGVPHAPAGVRAHGGRHRATGHPDVGVGGRDAAQPQRPEHDPRLRVRARARCGTGRRRDRLGARLRWRVRLPLVPGAGTASHDGGGRLLRAGGRDGVRCRAVACAVGLIHDRRVRRRSYVRPGDGEQLVAIRARLAGDGRRARRRDRRLPAAHGGADGALGAVVRRAPAHPALPLRHRVPQLGLPPRRAGRRRRRGGARARS